MGIHCEINLYKPMDGVFRPGNTVTGAVKYAVDEDTQFKAITLSLKGIGLLHVRKPHSYPHSNEANYYRSEKYADTDHVIMSDKKGSTVPKGLYEIQFSFELPQDVPSSLKLFRVIPYYHISCKISYYIRIKFERSGLMKRTKHYKKVIEVVSGIIPRLPTEPCVIAEKKTLSQPFTTNKTIDLKVTIENSVIPLEGGKIIFNYELSNDTNITVSYVKVKLFELYKFFINDNFRVDSVTAIKDTDSKTGSIQKRGTQNMDIEMVVPADVLGSFESAKIISREYIVGIEVKLPMPHRKIVLQIPVQIGNLSETIYAVNYNEMEAPPSYWEAMAEYKDDEDEKYKRSK